jgi:hypothetical protein
MKTTRKNSQKKNNEIDLTQPGESTNQTLPSAGLGDTIASITKAIGIEPCVGCKSRQERYNKLFPWLKLSRDYTEDEVDFIRSIASRQTMKNDEVNRLFALYNEVFPSKNPIQRCNCPGMIIKMIQRLEGFL